MSIFKKIRYYLKKIAKTINLIIVALVYIGLFVPIGILLKPFKAKLLNKKQSKWQDIKQS